MKVEICTIKFKKMENRYPQLEKNLIKQCKQCGRTHMRGACPALHQTRNNCHKKDTLPRFR